MRRALRGWLRVLPWLLLLAVMRLGSLWRYYLAPRHMPFLALGALALLGVVVLSEFDARGDQARSRRARLLAALQSGQRIETTVQGARPATAAEWLETAAHWLPPLLLLLLGPTTLSLGGAARSLHHLGVRAAWPAAAAATPLAATTLPPPTSVGGHAIAGHPAARKGPAGQRPPSSVIPPTVEARNALQQTPVASIPTPKKDTPLVATTRGAAQERNAQERALPRSAPTRTPARDYTQLDLVKLFEGKGGGTGAPVEVIGRLHRVKGDDDIVPVGVDPRKVKVVLYRYAIWCCVADAVPATAILDGEQAARVRDDGWVRLRGRLYRTGPEHDIPLLKVDHVEAIPAPADPYLYVQPGEL